MSRVKVFIEASNEHRTVSLGGRRRNAEGRVWLNTDNETEHDCGLRCSARSTSDEPGRGRSVFGIDMPSQADGNCEVHVRFSDSVPLNLAHVEGRYASAELFRSLQSHLQSGMPPVFLPGGVRLDEALACVELCRRIGVYSLDTSSWQPVQAPDDSIITFTRPTRRRFLILPADAGETPEDE